MVGVVGVGVGEVEGAEVTAKEEIFVESGVSQENKVMPCSCASDKP